MRSELYEKLTALQWLLHKQQMRNWAENGPMADTTRGQGRIIAVLKLRDGISTRDMSYLLGVRVSSLNELLSKLENSGYITREPSQEDKRVMLVRLTKKGRNERQPEPFDAEDIFTCLSEEEQKAFGEYLDRIIDALHTNFGDDSDEMLEKMEALRSRFGDMDLAFGLRMGHGHGRHRRGGFPGSGDFTGPDGHPERGGFPGPNRRDFFSPGKNFRQNEEE